jgi:hypothetical protein
MASGLPPSSDLEQPLNSVGPSEDHDEHKHYSHRAPWLRAFVLGANDGGLLLLSVLQPVGP